MATEHCLNVATVRSRRTAEAITAGQLLPVNQDQVNCPPDPGEQHIGDRDVAFAIGRQQALVKENR